LQKSKETGAELLNMANTTGEIHETLNGGISIPPPLNPAQLPPPPTSPTIFKQSRPAPTTNLDPSQSGARRGSQLQVQLSETQPNLTSYNEKMRNFEGMLAEHEDVKKELVEMRGL
jgi:hypothetical protein